MTQRHPTLPTATAIDTFAAAFDSLFTRVSQRQSFRHYLMGLLLPLETNKHLRGLARALPDTDSEALQHFLVDAPWSLAQLNRTRVARLQEHPATHWHDRGVLIIDETGDRKKGTCSDYVARQYLGRIGKIDNGVVCVTSHWADAQTHYPLDVLPYIPAGRLAQGKADPAFATKPQLAQHLVERARAAQVQFGAVVGDSFYGENSAFARWLQTEHIPYVLALKPSHAIWQYVPDWNDPPPFSPLEAAARVPRANWQVVERVMASGEPATWYAVDLAWGHYGVEHTTRLVVATTDPDTLPKDDTWCLRTNLQLARAPVNEIVRLYGLREWVEVFYKQAKGELGWADWEVRRGQAIQRHWHLVFCAYTFTLLHGRTTQAAEKKGSKEQPCRWMECVRRVWAWLRPWVDLRRWWCAWSDQPPPPELAALLAHVQQSRPLKT